MDSDRFCTIADYVRTLSVIVGKLARQDLEQYLEEAGVELTAVQYWVLRLLNRHAMTLADLSRGMKLDPSTLVPVVDVLERKGLIKRDQDPHDRRRTPLRTTSAGIDLLAKVPQPDEKSALVKSLRLMGDEQSEQLLSLLSQFVMNLSDDKELIDFCQSIYQYL